MTLNKLIDYLDAIRKGSMNAFIDPESFSGTEKELAEAVRTTIQDLVRKNEWYEAVLDAIPFPMSVTDMNMNWTFINRSTENMLNLSRADIMGKHCSNWGANICNTSNCGIHLLRKGVNFSLFEQGGGNFRTDVSYITTRTGEKIGHVEIVTDQTGIIKVNNYLHSEITKTASNLEKLAAGNLDLDYTTTEGDEHTKEVSGLFKLINTSMKQASDALSLMTSDAISLSKAVINGKLDTKADVSRHQGEFKKIVEGINNILDSVIIPVNEARKVSGEYANYNFASRVDETLNFSGDWMTFRDALNNIGIQISNLVGLINNNLLELALNAEKAAASIEEVTQGTQQITKNAGEVSNNSTIGEDGIIQVLKAMEDLNVTVAEVSRRAEEVSVTATKANEYAKTGVELAQKSESAMSEIKKSSIEAGEIVRDINHQMDEIGKIVRLISDIANQTNLLALNAAIEAARAGEAGRGFAVVASEVKSLALDSRRSAENITDMISALQNNAKKANEAMEHSSSTVETGSAALSETLGVFNQIATSIEDITRNATDVASSSEEQAASVEEVTASINEVSSLMQSTTKDAGNVEDVAKETSLAIEQIGGIVTRMNEIVDLVSKEMAKFRVNLK